MVVSWEQNVECLRALLKSLAKMSDWSVIVEECICLECVGWVAGLVRDLSGMTSVMFVNSAQTWSCWLHISIETCSCSVYIAGIIDMFCLCYCFLCVLYTLAYVWCNDHVNSCLHIDFFIECRPHICQHIHRTQNVGTFVEQISDFSCVACRVI